MVNAVRINTVTAVPNVAEDVLVARLLAFLFQVFADLLGDVLSITILFLKPVPSFAILPSTQW